MVLKQRTELSTHVPSDQLVIVVVVSNKDVCSGIHSFVSKATHRSLAKVGLSSR